MRPRFRAKLNPENEDAEQQRAPYALPRAGDAGRWVGMMTREQNILSEIVVTKSPTYLGLIARVLAVFGIQACFKLSPFNFQARPDASPLQMLGFGIVFIPTYTLLVTYAIQAVIRIGTVSETPDAPRHEKIIAVICLIVTVMAILYVWLAADPHPPWYMEE